MAKVELPNPNELLEHVRDPFGRRVALVTAVFAVLLAIAALGHNHTMKEVLLAQEQSSDKWAFYQAKVIREHQYKSQKLRLEADLVERLDTMKPAAREKFETLMKTFEGEETRYNAEKKDIEKDARRLEHEREVWQAKDPYFLFAEAVLQIAIVMASISILARSRSIFGFSLLLAAGGSLFTVNGFFTFVHLPLLGGH